MENGEVKPPPVRRKGGRRPKLFVKHFCLHFEQPEWAPVKRELERRGVKPYAKGGLGGELIALIRDGIRYRRMRQREAARRVLESEV